MKYHYTREVDFSWNRQHLSQGLSTHSLQGQNFPQRHNCAFHPGQKYLDEVSEVMGFLEGGDHEGGTIQDAPDCLTPRWRITHSLAEVDSLMWRICDLGRDN